MKRTFTAALLALAALTSPLAAAEQSTMDPRFLPPPTEAACRSLQLAATGGPLPSDPKVLAVRWLGFATYELDYGKTIILLDNYYDRGPRYRYLGFKAADVKRANLIIVGHAHADHMSDTAQTALQTGAPVVAAPITAARLFGEGIDPKAVTQVTGTDGRVLHYNGFTVAYRDSGGIMTDYEKSTLAKIGRVDVLIGAIAGNSIAESNLTLLMPMIDTYRPAVYFPAHHEEEVGRNLDRATEPMFQAIKNAYPGTVTVSKEFREPTCFDTRINLRAGYSSATPGTPTPK